MQGIDIDTDVTETYGAFFTLLAQGADQILIATNEISWIIPAIYANKDGVVRKLRSLSELLLAEDKDFFSIEVPLTERCKGNILINTELKLNILTKSVRSESVTNSELDACIVVESYCILIWGLLGCTS